MCEAFIVIFGVLVVCANIQLFRARDQWHVYGHQMRRRINGRWEYRDMTEEELRNDLMDRAW